MYLTSSPVLTSPKKKEDMMLYISATSTVVSAATVVEREEEGYVYKVQWQVYYISEVLTDSTIPTYTEITLRPPNHFSQATRLL
jgi:hypothetical protein